MISVADLLTNNRVPGNYFATDVYVRSDLELGLLENRRGDRLLALPQTLLQAIYAGLEKETGQATGLVLFNCGKWWGKNFYTRFQDELSDYYGQALSEMAMAEFLQCLQQCWVTHGWGKIELEYEFHTWGYLVIKSWNSPFAHQAPQGNLPVCYFEAGILSAFFSALTGRELHCVQTTCESLGADANRFVVGLTKRLDGIVSMVEQRIDHDTIMNKLCA